MVKISVIIPCYNVEKYIDVCIRSVVDQTIGIENIQIIAVDDASTDGTLQCLADWDRKYPDSMLVVACDNNGKQGTARNIGIGYAEGEYIFFLDGDDFIELNALSEMYECAKSSGADVVKIKYAVDYCNESEFVVSAHERNDAVVDYDPHNGRSFLDENSLGNNGNLVGAAGSLYRKDFIDENSLRFPEGLSYEDNYWNSVSAAYIKRLYVIDMCYYHYRVNSESTVNKRNNPGLLDKPVVELMILEEYRRIGLFELYCSSLFFQFLQRSCFNFLYQLFFRFDDLPIDLNELKTAMWYFFERYRYALNVGNYQGPEYEKIILEYLVSDEEYTLDMQLMMKHRYIESVMKSKQ